MRLYLFAYFPGMNHKRWSVSRSKIRSNETEIGSRGDGWRIVRFFLFEFNP